MTMERLDAASSAFFARELEQVKARSYDVVKAPLRAFDLIPVDTSTNAGATAITYQQYDGTGIAKIISNYASDLPVVDILGKEFTANVKSVGAAFNYSRQEIRAAMMAGKPLEQRKANQAVRAHREQWNRIAFHGDAEFNLQGWLTNPNIPAAPVAADGGPGEDDTRWSTKTAAQIIRDINALVNGIVSLTNGAEQPNTLVLPIDQYTLISTTNAGTGTDTTILQYVLANSPFLQAIEWANELKGAGPEGVDIMIAYDRSPDKLTLEMPMMYTQYAPQEKGLAFEVPTESRIGGVLIYYPLSMAIGEGI